MCEDVTLATRKREAPTKDGRREDGVSLVLVGIASCCTYLGTSSLDCLLCKTIMILAFERLLLKLWPMGQQYQHYLELVRNLGSGVH